MTERPEKRRLRSVEAFPATVEGQPVVCLRDPSAVTEEVLAVPRPLLPILALFEGAHALLDVQAEIVRRHGELVPDPGGPVSFARVALEEEHRA